MNLYNRDYMKGLLKEETEKYNAVLEMEKGDLKIGRKNLYPEYPVAVHRYNSFFPNHHIELCDLKREFDLEKLNSKFLAILQNDTSKERDILKFINHEHAYHIIASLFSSAGITVGHHSSNYLFPEFPIGGGKYRADYLLIGNGSGGHEFVFIELEAPNGRTTIKSGEYGEATRKGHNQIVDWQSSLESEFDCIKEEFQKEKGHLPLPAEFDKYDSTRMHYVVVTGRRKDYNDTTYRMRRKEEGGIKYLHYDNLYDGAERLLEVSTF